MTRALRDSEATRRFWVPVRICRSVRRRFILAAEAGVERANGITGNTGKFENGNLLDILYQQQFETGFNQGVVRDVATFLLDGQFLGGGLAGSAFFTSGGIP